MIEKIPSSPVGVTTGKVTIKEDLPRYYGETRIVLLPRDPFWAFAYWEISDETKEQIKKQYSGARLCLRVYDVTGITFDGKNSHKYFDVLITEQADNWYINISEMNRSWCVDLGLLLSDGTFVTITRSNVVHMPKYGVSPITDEQWAVLQKEFDRLLQLSGVEYIGKGSFDIARLMRERWEEIVSISSAQLPASPRGMPSSGVIPQKEEK